MMSKKTKIFYFIAFFLLQLGSPLLSKNFNFRNFSIQDGLPDAIITSTLQTNDGFVYFTTLNGLSKFDGKKAINFSIEDGLINSNIQTALEFEPNKLLLATLGGLSVFDGHSFINYTIKDGLSNDSVYALFKYNDKHLIGTKKGISVYKGGKFLKSSEFNFFRNMRINDFSEDASGNLIVGTDRGLFKYHGNTNSLIKGNINVLDLFLAKDSTLWVGSTNGVFRCKKDTLFADSMLAHRIVNSITIDDREQIWFGTMNGIVKKNKNKYFSYTNSTYFHGRECFNIFQDIELNIWIATNHGVYIFDDGKFTLYDRRDGISSSCWGILERTNGEIWVATDGNGVLKLEGNKFSEIPILSKLPKTVWNIFEDKKNNTWFSTSKGAFCLDTNNALTHFTKRNGFTDDMIIGISEDKDGNLWFTSFKTGVFKYNGKFFKHLSMKNAGSSPIFGTVLGFNNCMWIYSGSGIDRIFEDKNVDFPDSKLLNEYSYYSMIIDNKNKNYLLGTFERGLIIYNPKYSTKEERVKYITVKNNLSSNKILFTKFDDNDSTLWIGTDKGLNKLDYQNFINTGKIDIKSYNDYDGFPSIECNQFGAIVDLNSIFWFSTKLGIVTYDKTKERENIFTSSPVISSVEINYKVINLEDFGSRNIHSPLGYDNLSFPYYMNNITFHYTALHYTNPFDIQYSYRLIGSNETFSPLNQNEYITFSGLRPGNYTFELISYTENGYKKSQTVSYSFTITPPLWKSNWFFSALLILSVLAIYIVYRIRTQSIRKKNLELLKLHRENLSYQKQLIESEKDYKGLFENAHNAILIVDINSLLIVDANNSAVDLFGYQINKIKNLSIKVLEYEKEKITDLLNEVLLKNNVKNWRTTYLRKNGDKVKLSVNANLINFRGKKALIAVLRDITIEEETKSKLLAAKNAAEKSDNLKGEFLAQISHEIRTPINTMLGYVTLIIGELREFKTEIFDEYYLPIKRSSERLIRTVDLILNTSDAIAGTLDLEMAEYNISDILEEIIIEHRQAAKDKNLALTFNQKSDIKLIIDYHTFRQIFVNLIDNAIKYTSKGQIDVTLSKTEEKTIIEIKDTGIGISEKFISDIYRPFTQEEQGYTRAFDGNGLGLTLVKNYVQINNGDIFVTSTKGIGTIFTIKF